MITASAGLPIWVGFQKNLVVALAQRDKPPRYPGMLNPHFTEC